MTHVTPVQDEAAAAAESRPREIEAFLEFLQNARPEALTSCPGRTAHTMGAHVAGAFEEIARHVEAFAEGRPITRTRTFDERELPYRQMTPAALLRSCDEQEERMRVATHAVLRDKPDARMRWTGRLVQIKGFLSHMRNECALHRWDGAGDDATSYELLSRHELLEHSLEFLGPLPLFARGRAAGAGAGAPLDARMRSDGYPDLRIRVRSGVATVALEDPVGEPTVAGDPAARLLMLWGRKPHPIDRLTAHRPLEEVERLQLLLSGY